MEKAKRFVPESVKIEDGISKLKSAGIWPENVVNPIPAYSDESGTLYLQIVLKEFSDRYIKAVETANLAAMHPPSLNRSVCVVFETVCEGDSLIETYLTTLGVLGEITITSSKDIKKSVLQKSDTIIVTPDVSKEIVKSLQSQINEPGKIIFRLNKSNKGTHYKKKLEYILRSTPIIPNAADSSFVVKVGHTGMAARKIEDNIASLFQRINIGGRFRGGWSAIKRINLKTGTSRAVSIYEDTDMQIKMSKKMKRAVEEANGYDGPRPPKKAKQENSGVIPSGMQSGAKADSPNLKRKLEDAVQPNSTASISPKNEKKEKKAKAFGGNLSGIATPKPTGALANGSSPKDEDASPPKPNKKRQRGKGKEQTQGEEQSLDSKDLMSMLINQAKMSVLSPVEEAADMASTPDQQSKKNKKNKSPKKQGGAKNLVSVQKDGALSDEFKMNMLERLQLFTRGTELEDIIVPPGKETEEVTPLAAGSPGSPKKKKNKKKKSLTAVNSVSPLANGNVQGKAQAGSPGNNSLKKKKNKKNKTPQKVNGVAPVANENSSVTANVKSVANGSAGKTVKVTKVVALESPGSKLKKKKKNKSPKKAKVAAL